MLAAAALRVGRSIPQWRDAATWSMMVHMRTTSLVSAKAHLSELVDEAEHRGKRILILRHGTPAAAIVPVSVAMPAAPRRVLTRAQAKKRLDALARDMKGDPLVSAVEDLLAGRR